MPHAPCPKCSGSGRETPWLTWCLACSGTGRQRDATVSLWHDAAYVAQQVALAKRALARAKRTYGERSLRYADKLGELRNAEQRLRDIGQAVE